MSAGSGAWTVRLTDPAEADFADIVRWTAVNFGEAQAVAYAQTLLDALDTLKDGPATLGVKQRDDILPGLFTFHVARKNRRGRHFVMFRIGGQGETKFIDVLRLLHDSMDLVRHLPSE